jgi:hypothetical protein
MTAVSFCLFEVTLKKDRTPSVVFEKDGLVRAAERYVTLAGNEVWFCATVQPDAFRQHLEARSDVEHFREIV